MFGQEDKDIVEIDSDVASGEVLENEAVSEPTKTVACTNCDDSGKACYVCHAGDLVE